MGSTEDAIRKSERIDTLLEVVMLAEKLDTAPDVDPYLWGYGGREIVKALKAMLTETVG